MPKAGVDRDAFVARVDKRRNWARYAIRARQMMRVDRRSYQAALYEATFRSDAEAIAYQYARRNDHLPDLDAPVWLNEKIRWQFIHHPNPLMSYAADKISVRRYLDFKGARIGAPRLIATGSAPEALADAALPDAFVLKTSFGSGQNHIETPGKNTPRAELVAKVRHWMGYDQWRQTGELHYRDVPKRWLVEEYLSPRRKMLEYKLTCIMGEPVFIAVITDRGVDGREGLAGVRHALFDLNWRRTPFSVRGVEDDPRDVPAPPGLDLLIEEARRLSRDFMHVRVDFLRCDDVYAFSELTFASMAARVPFDPPIVNEQLGHMMKLEHAPAYLELGRSTVSVLESNAEVREAMPLAPVPYAALAENLRASA